jgi:cardiolipin synthase
MDLLHWLITVGILSVSVYAAGHALLYKRDPKASVAWIIVCMSFPLAGPFLYFLIGINRVHIRGRKMNQYWPYSSEEYGAQQQKAQDAILEHELPCSSTEILRISNAVTQRPLTSGNTLKILHNGEEAYPAMLQAIDNAQETIFFCTYILESNQSGLRFIQALNRAAQRGVTVCVILDGIGECYTLPRAGSILLKQKKVRLARFLPLKIFPPTPLINLRNHRKILVTDGKVGFTGGMNVGDRHLAQDTANPSRVTDLHFQLSGPIVNQMEDIFHQDWYFCTGEELALSSPSQTESKGAICRAIEDGPNEELDKLAMIINGCISTAHKKVNIMTPYFLPSRTMIGALQTAALRGVEVNIILPQKNNIPFVKWASTNMLWEILQQGVRVFYQPPPFAHTKLFLVDNHYAMLGSANLDPRSLRLNFEMVIETFDQPFVQKLNAYFDDILQRSSETSLQEVDSRPLPIRVRDSLCWLFSPYL